MVFEPKEKNRKFEEFMILFNWYLTNGNKRQQRRIIDDYNNILNNGLMCRGTTDEN